MEKFGDASKEAANKIGQGAKEAGQKIGDQAQSMGSNAAKKAEDITGKAGNYLESFGETIREHSPQHGMIGDAGHAIAEKFESGGRYLEQKGFGGMGDDLTSLIRTNPIPALLVGVGLGFLLAKVMRS